MSGSWKWIERAVHRRVCPNCLAQFTRFATRGISVRLLPRPDGEGFGALYPTLIVPCPTCQTEHRITVGDVSRADLKKGIDWLHQRTLGPDDPFTNSWGPDLMPNGEGDPHLLQPPPQTPEGQAREASGTGQGEPSSGNGERGRSKSLGGQPPRIKPSIRTCCPPQPITDQTVQAAKRKLRTLSFCRTAPSFARLLKGFGVEATSSDSNFGGGKSQPPRIWRRSGGAADKPSIMILSKFDPDNGSGAEGVAIALGVVKVKTSNMHRGGCQRINMRVLAPAAGRSPNTHKSLPRLRLRARTLMSKHLERAFV